MKKLLLAWILLVPFTTQAQFGIKAGVNFANVTNASSINSKSTSGFHAGVFLSPPSKGILSSRTEILFSRQGYDYKTSTTTGEVDLDYILLPQLMSINATKYISIQLGAQVAYLISAKVDSSNANTGNNYAGKLMDLYNRFDYGFAAGVEVHPVSGLLVGARYNISLGKVYKSIESGEVPSFTVEDAKNNVVQVFAGWRFGAK